MPATDEAKVTGVMAQAAGVARGRVEVMARAAALGAGGPGGASSAQLEWYYRHVADEDVLTRRPQDLLGAMVSHRRLAQHRPVGTAAVRVLTPAPDRDGWTSSHTVVEIVTDDMPFLVDSVTAELSRLGRAIHLVVHPQLVVRRDAAGELVDVVGLPTQPLPYDCYVESWMHLEIDRDTDAQALDQLAADLRRVLGDVRVCVEDWARMHSTATFLADELVGTPPPGVDGDEVDEAARLLR